jgi:hypothetical protein
MAIQIKLKNSVVQDSTPSTSDLPAVGEIALNANINSIGGFMRASDNSIVKIFGPGSLSTPTATTTVSGISELATNTETTTGTATNRVVTPAGLNAVTVAERSTSNSTYLALAGGTLTGVVAATAGSNSAPSIHFGDSDSGIFGGTNTVSLAAGGTTRLTADTGVSVVGTLAVTGAITSTSDLTIPDKIIHSGDTNTAIRFPAADTVSVETGGNEAIRINDSGQVLVGVSSTRTMFTGYTPSLQVEGNAKSDSASSLVVNNASTVGPTLWFGKTRGTSVGSNTVVQSGDELGTIFFNGADGTDVQSIAASIRSEVDGTPGSNDMPGRLVFSTTADGAASPTERLRISSAGNVGIGTASPDSTLHLDASGGAVLKLQRTSSNASNRLAISHDGTDGTLDSSNATLFRNNGAERMRITSAGLVGIGTTSPSTALHINTGSSGLPKLRLQHSGASNDVFEITGGLTGVSNGGFGIYDVDESAYRLAINSSGNVGIGTTSPSTKLEVNGTVTATTFAGNIDAVDGDFDGTLEADAITVGGVALNTVIAGVTVTNATNATVAASVTVVDESSDTTCFPLFADSATGNLSVKSGTNLTFNSSSGRLTATSFAGDGSNLTGVGGDVVDDTSPQLGGNLDCNNKVVSLNDSTGSDNNRIKFGNAGDLQIYHDASNSYIDDSGTGSLFIRGSDLYLTDEDGTNMLYAANNAGVNLYHGGSKKFSTESFGVDIDGTLRADTLKLAADNHKLEIGGATNGDLVLYHDGSNSYVVNSNSSADLILQSASGVDIKHGTETMIQCNGDGEVKLFYNDTARISTSGNGIIVHSNNVSMDSSASGGLRIDGNGYSGAIALDADGMHIYHNSTSRALIFGVNESEVARFNTDGHFRPSANNTRDLGTSSLRWRNLYTNDLNLSNEGGANDVDGTWGSYTIQEGAEDLFLINKRSGKKYKFNLTEVA